MVERHQQFGDLALILQLLDGARCDLLTGFGNHFTGGGIDQIIGRAGATHAVREEGGDPAPVAIALERHRVVIGVHDRFLIQPKGVEQGRHGQLAAAVDPGEHDVLGVELEIQPGAAIGNDAAGEQQLAGGVRLALVMVEEHTGRAVHLGDDHTLRAVHDEGAVMRHQGHVAHEHILLLDVFHGLCTRVLIHIEHDQAQGHLQRRAVGHVTLLTLLHVVLGLFQLVLDEFEDARLVEILDREDRLEHAHQAFAVERDRTVAGAQEQIVGGFLDFDEVRHRQRFADLAVVFADTFLAEEGLSHARRISMSYRHCLRRAYGDRHVAIVMLPYLGCLPQHPSRSRNGPFRALSTGGKGSERSLQC